jgi:hypothetical protein
VKFGVESLHTVLLINYALGENHCLQSQAVLERKKFFELNLWTVRPTCMRFGRKYINSDLVGDSGFSKNWHSKGHTFFTVVNEFLSPPSNFLSDLDEIRYNISGYNSFQHLWVSFKSAHGRPYFSMELCLHQHHKPYAILKGLGEVCVLHYRVRHLLFCYYSVGFRVKADRLRECSMLKCDIL